MNPIDAYPVAIVQDRYGGTYSRGEWLAVGGFDERDVRGPRGPTRLDFVMLNAHGSDPEAMDFWTGEARELSWLAVGETPDHALAALYARDPRQR
jgi:hypothetical protein